MCLAWELELRVILDRGAFLSPLDLDLFIPTPAAREQNFFFQISLFICSYFVAFSLSTGSFSRGAYTHPHPIFSAPYLKSCYTEIIPFSPLPLQREGEMF